MKEKLCIVLALFLVPVSAVFAISMYAGVVEGKITDESG